MLSGSTKWNRLNVRIETTCQRVQAFLEEGDAGAPRTQPYVAKAAC